jgi:hypothetical protein
VERRKGIRHNPFVSDKTNTEIMKSRSRQRKKPPPSHLINASHDPLTESELKFCREYAIDHNGTRAYRLAFPTKSYGTARANASRLCRRRSKRNARGGVVAAE